MYRLTAKIEITQKESRSVWTFDKVHSVEITRDSETLTDTCVLKLPRKIRWKGVDSNPLRRGDSIKIWLGYDNRLELAFAGYLTTIGFRPPITINCEDKMFELKSLETKKKAYTKVTIEELLRDQGLGDMNLKVVGEQNIGQYRVTAKTVTELLGNLKDNGGIRTFFKLSDGEPTLYSGVLFPFEKGYSQVFKTGVNIIKDESLKKQNAEDVRLKVKAVSLLPNNKKIRVEVGYTDGETRTIHAYNKTEPELKAWAEQELKRMTRDGLTGSFTTFGHKLIDKLENVALILYGEKKGIYQVTKNVIKYSPEGFRQEITIGNRSA